IETNGLMLDEVAAKGLDPALPDNRILAAALGQARSVPTTVVSNDAALRIKAAPVGLGAAEHVRRRAASDDEQRRRGWAPVEVSADVVDLLYASPAGVELAELGSFGAAVDAAVGPNGYGALRAGSQSVLARRTGDRLV